MMLNKTVIELEEFNQHKILNLLNNEKVKVLDFKKYSNKKSRLTVDKKDSKKTFAIFEKMCYTYTVVSNQGGVDLLRQMRRRAGLLIGLIAIAALIIFMKSFVWYIDVTGNDKLSREEIIGALKSYQVGVGKSLRQIDPKALELGLMEMEGVAGCSVSLSGTRLKVQILEKNQTTPPEDVKESFSGYDAVVTRIIVDAGTSKVKVGDIVKKGEPLIEGAVYGTDGLLIKTVVPKGEVYGKVVFTYSKIISSESYRFVRTGKSYTETKIRFFNLSPKFCCKYESYESEKQTVKMQNSLFPLQFERVTFYETRPEKIVSDAESLIAAVKEEVKEKMVFNKGGVILSEKAESKVLSGNQTRLDIFIEAEMLL